MLKRVFAFVFVTAILVGAALPATAALAGDNGQKIGQDDLRLALTQCSNAGKGNGGEWEVGLITRRGVKAVYSECLEKRLLGRYTREEIAAILAQANCYAVGPIVACEVDPGNSAAHNQAGP